MYLARLKVEGFRLFGTPFEMPLTPGLNVLAGENDSGKTAIIDAIRLALGTTSQDFQRVDDDDFYLAVGKRATEFTIQCKFAGIDQEAGGALLEHLTYEDGDVCLYVTFSATRNEALAPRRRITVTVRSGRDGNGPVLDATLVLETFFKEHDLADLLPWLIGQGSKKREGSERKDRMRLIYTAMTRPTHLLCLAMRDDALGVGDKREANVRCLQSAGWIVTHL